MTDDFFKPGRTYRHYDEHGEPSTEGLFTVVFAGRAPAAFEHHSETLGVAFGWRQGIGPSGEWEALGAYDTPDFAGWREVRDVQRPNLPPNGCRWCGEPKPHGLMYRAGVGLHGWAQPTDRQRLERMQERRAQRLVPRGPLDPATIATITANASALYRQFAPEPSVPSA